MDIDTPFKKKDNNPEKNNNNKDTAINSIVSKISFACGIIIEIELIDRIKKDINANKFSFLSSVFLLFFESFLNFLNRNIFNKLKLKYRRIYARAKN